jgi:preprotein translocase subunit SecD
VRLRSAAPGRVPRPGGTRRWFGVAAALLVAVSLATVWWPPGRLLAPRYPDTTLETVGTPAHPDLDRTVTLLRQRLAAAGYTGSRVAVTGPRTVTVSGADPDAVRQLAAPGRVTLHAILGGPVTPDPPVPENPDAARDLAALRAKLGAAYELASRLRDPSEVDTVRAVALRPFGTLTPAEVALLPPLMRFAVPAIGCAQLGTGPADGETVACQPGQGKYLLAAPGVGPPDLAGAHAVLDPRAGWSARLRFTAAGRGRWTALLAAVRADPVSRDVAVVVDGDVLTARGIGDPGTADGLVTRYGLDALGAVRLAALIGTGPLPVTFRAG